MCLHRALEAHREWAGTKVGPDQHKSITSNPAKKKFCKPKLFDVCTNVTKDSLKIRARVISRGLSDFFYVNPR